MMIYMLLIRIGNKPYRFNINWIHLFQFLQQITTVRIKRTGNKAVDLYKIWHDWTE